MPDKTPEARATKVEVESTSGTFKAVMPTAHAKTPTDTRLQITPGTSVHEVLLSDVPHEADPPGSAEPPPPHERRRQQTPVNVQVQQPPSGGLTGTWASVANLSAVGAFLLLTFLMYRDFVANVRDRDQLIREEMRQTRSSDQSSQAAMIAALGGLTTKMDALAISNNAMAASNNAMVTEFRQSQQELRSLMKALAKMPPDHEPVRDEGVIAPAPAPRSRAGCGG